MRAATRILVGTLHAGEQEFERCRGSLELQRHTAWEQVVLRDLPNAEAHRRLYQTFAEEAKHFDLFLKLDADMVLRDDRALGEIVRLFERRPALDHAEIAVQDWFSGQRIMGMHVFTPRVHWPDRDEPLFVDLPPRYAGEHTKIWEAPAPLADHAPDPSAREAFLFGVHRALKVVQAGRSLRDFDAHQSLSQLDILIGTLHHYHYSRDRRLALALVGAGQVLGGAIAGTLLHAKREAFQAEYRAVDGLSEAALDREVIRYWQHPRRRRRARWLRARGRGAARLALRLGGRFLRPS